MRDGLQPLDGGKSQRSDPLNLPRPHRLVTAPVADGQKAVETHLGAHALAFHGNGEFRGGRTAACNHGCGTSIALLHSPTRRSRILHSIPFAGTPLPRIFRAPSFLLAVNLSRTRANASFTNSLLPITAPSVKYLTRFISIPAIPRSGRKVSLSSDVRLLRRIEECMLLEGL